MVVKHISFFLVSRHECGNTLCPPHPPKKAVFCNNLIEFYRTFHFQKTILPFSEFPPTKEIPVHMRLHIQRNIVEAPTASCIVAQKYDTSCCHMSTILCTINKLIRRYGRSLCLVTFACNYVRVNILPKPTCQ